jgi:glycosyltransferase involved in cell wall biosynthesis
MFTIIMPIWNRAAIAPRAIKSILCQTYQNFELFIIDYRSEDNLEEAISPYLSERVILYQVPTRGLSVARNFGLKHANGDFIAYLDTDNTWHPQFLSVMWEALNNTDKSNKVAYCRYHLYKKIPIINKIFLRGVKGKAFNFEELLKRNYIDINTVVHARECIETVGFFDETLNRFEDWDFIIRMTAIYEPLFVKEVLVNYYLNICENSITKMERGDTALQTIREKNLKYSMSGDRKKKY